MRTDLIKLQLGSLEQQIKVLKFKLVSEKKKKSLSDLCGAFEGKLDLSLPEIKKYEYSFPE